LVLPLPLPWPWVFNIDQLSTGSFPGVYASSTGSWSPLCSSVHVGSSATGLLNSLPGTDGVLSGGVWKT
jgi:hypothetical protein